MKFFIYILIDPRTNSVRYVGATNSLQRRISNHLCPSALAEKHHRARWLVSLARENLRPIVRVIEETDESKWQVREIAWIAYYRRIGADLTNTAAGGRGGGTGGRLGRKQSEATKLKISQTKKGRKCELSEDERKAIGQKIWEARRANGTTGLGRIAPHTTAAKERMRSAALFRIYGL